MAVARQVAIDALRGTLSPFNARQNTGQPNIISVFGSGLGVDATDTDGNQGGQRTGHIWRRARRGAVCRTRARLHGLNQLNIQFPASIAAGTHTMVISRNGIAAPVRAFAKSIRTG
jgi:hypothetical protein